MNPIKLLLDDNADRSNDTDDDDKVSKGEVGYVNESPKPDQCCGNCTMFRGGGAVPTCTLVEGLIEKDGWCEEWYPEKSQS